ncbi:glycosyltransferase [Granulicella mallensis]|uniref:UDP:flavonoid glycosyltransferase YjiC (YdhE family) n=1 Tax=Granulicella mallensis TaxID=940614 RepID=A0A7W7ZTM5_9BACT|nr:glycosyltransferase [Granulicella mallensis]MBB5065903.1 UDP:flavonoid glycosyltransferase YjiC (YdhE family) [Granulicella mallensis]
MKILIASIGVPGHLNPLLSAASIFAKHGHEVAVQTSNEMQAVIEAAGVTFLPEIPEANTSGGYFFANFPERQEKTPGMEMIAFDLEHFFARNLPAQAASLKAALRDFPADLILADSMYWGTLPMLLEPREQRPAIAHMGISILNLGSGKNLPQRPGSSEEERSAERQRRVRVMLKPGQMAVDRALASVGCSPLPCPVMESLSSLSDLYLHPGIESFEYPDTDGAVSKVRYIGPLPLAAGQAPLPEWWADLDKTKRLVLVTQGTIANRDLGQLIGPTLTALAEEEDLLVLVTTGNAPAESIPVELPKNARVASFLPYEQVMPHIDLLITNGGYGTVNMALAHGIAVISAGLTEDKEEVSAHMQWAGVGLDLRTNQATPEAVHAATREILDTPGYREQAKKFALEFASHDAEAELLSAVEACVQQLVEA